MPEIGSAIEASRSGAYSAAYSAAAGLRPSGAAADSAAGRASDPASAESSGTEEATPSTVVALSPAGRAAAGSSLQLSPVELREVERLKARDREVRAHEQAHQAAAGGLASGGASYTYQRGPDGVSYAVGGEVPISLREGRTPEETIANAQTIRAAALAPSDPSPQDRAVAAAAGQMEARARTELARQEQEGGAEPVPGTAGGSPERGDVADPSPVPASGAAGRPTDAASSDQSIPAGDSAARAARTRDVLAGVYGLIAANSSGFSVRA